MDYAKIAEMEYEWDPEKAVINLVKHGVTFHEASFCLLFGTRIVATLFASSVQLDSAR